MWPRCAHGCAGSGWCAREGACVPWRASRCAMANRRPPAPAAPQTDTDHPTPDAAVQARVGRAVAVGRWCVGWLEPRERVAMVVATLRPDIDERTACVQGDDARVRRLLAWMHIRVRCVGTSRT